MCMNTLCLELTSIPQPWTHPTDSSRSAWRSKWSVSLLVVFQILTSSENNNVGDLGKSGNSLAYRRRSKELQMVPWITQHLTSSHSDCVPLTHTLYLRPYKKFPIHSSTAPVIPKLDSFCIKLKCETLSNVLVKSMNIISTGRSLSNAAIQSSLAIS